MDSMRERGGWSHSSGLGKSIPTVLQARLVESLSGSVASVAVCSPMRTDAIR
jgi:hypothetical protein